MELKKILEKRRSFYDLGKDLPIPQDEFVGHIKDLTELVPDAFNMKSARVLVLFDEKHELLWDTLDDVFNGQVPKEKIDNFKKSAGTILFFYDSKVVKGLEEKFPLYAKNFVTWANHANGMLQYIIWSGLAELEIGASLQHYNPVIDEKVREVFNLPQEYVLLAQMPFGNILSPAKDKDREDINLRVEVRK